MLYHLLYPLHTVFSVLNVFRYITFRTIYAAITALLISFILGPWIIRKLNSTGVITSVREDVPTTHSTKAGIPTMGGILILIALVIPTLLWADLTNTFIWLVLAATLLFGLIGFADDLLKLKKGRGRGLKGRYKIVLQGLVALAVSGILVGPLGFDTRLYFPFLKGFTPDLGWFYVPFVVLVILGTSNAVNLTDGLDGLAIGPILVSSGTFLLFCYLAGHSRFAEYLQIAYVAGSGELTVFCGAMVGASLGFLWFNTYPAQVFMGDIGSLALGAALGLVAVIAKQELLLVIVGGIFVLEAVSVILQVASFRVRRKRVFNMAPIHHHFELKGWPEPKVIVRFWIIAIILGLIAISTLKLR
ncbi:MAG: phospho-N-acetylmuramoyl-pentapeptide-transferase [Deltaproteobacteria bacterium]|nr:phospho-N-acetylmuramoyl-pentapeptide-transferase [Deltaproteobacteria bacterium]